MKSALALLPVLLLILTGCGNTPAPTAADPTPEPDPTANLPADLVATLDAHGGLDAWRGYRQLSYAMPRGEDQELQLVDIHDRREYIRQPGGEGEAPVEIGYDGENLWITADTTYKGNPAFYKNLMFYFYAMPWVLADDGINYAAAEPLEFDGTTYPGILVSYDDGVGFSPKDNYRLHYDPTTKKMRWLGYTVTGRSGKPSDKFSWIEYPTWSDHGGVELADSLVWYATEENLPVAPRNTRVFEDVRLTKSTDGSKFERIAGARLVE